MAGSRSLRGLIVLIASAGGRVDTRIKIQKEAFLLAASNAGEFKVSSFGYHHYGPYSREISDVIQFAVSSKLVTELKENTAGDGVKYSYSLTPKGESYLVEAGEPSENESRLVEMMHEYHWRTLELAATVRYLEINLDFRDRSKAMIEALRLKPDTKSYQAEAGELLGKLDRERAVHVENEGL